MTSTSSPSFCFKRRAVAMPPNPPPKMTTRFIKLLSALSGGLSARCEVRSRRARYQITPCFDFVRLAAHSAQHEYFLIQRQVRIHFFCPGIDAAFEVLDLLEPGAG